jgi:hypothetical protein
MAWPVHPAMHVSRGPPGRSSAGANLVGTNPGDSATALHIGFTIRAIALIDFLLATHVLETLAHWWPSIRES